jgi:predicted RNA-binding Zn ribbon-like protein
MVVSMHTDWVEVLLDLLNTTPVVDGVGSDVLSQSWLRERGAGEDLDAVRRVRDDLQKVVRGRADAAVLHGYLASVRQVPRIDDDGLHWELDESADLAARVVLAWGEVQRDRPGRLRACANDECQLFLLDRSRGGTGRWCSMSGCGNRMKARRHYSRIVGS